MDQQEVEYYNNKTFEQASFIISKKELNIQQHRDVTSLKISPVRKAELTANLMGLSLYLKSAHSTCMKYLPKIVMTIQIITFVFAILRKIRVEQHIPSSMRLQKDFIL